MKKKKKKKRKITSIKPPDKYRCIKIPLKKIIKKKKYKKKIFDCVVRTNKIIIKTYQLLRLWVLSKYRKKKEIPKITRDIIKMCMKSIVNKSAGQKPKGINLNYYNEFTNLYSFDLEDGTNLSQILSYNAVTILTAIENNIKCHYFDYIRRFINSYFKHKYEEEIKNKEFKQELFKELKKVKNDIINDTTECDKKYHKWLNKNRHKIIPKEYKKSYYYDIQVNPQKYLGCMIWMNIELEKINGKMYQFFPLRTDIIPKYVPIDSKSIIELFSKDKNKYLTDIENKKQKLWKKYFDIKVKMKNYSFEHTIITDGFSSSIRFIHNSFLQAENKKKENMRKARQQYKGLLKEERVELKKKNEGLKKQKEKQRKKIKEKENKPKDKKPKKDKIEYIEFPYIDEVDKKKLKGKHIFIDPGKKDLLSIIDDNGIRLHYSNSRRVSETKRLKYQRLIKNYKDKLGISSIENELSDYNSKTCNLTKFKKYIKEKNKINNKLFELYEDEKFRKYKWYSFINTKSCEDNMLNLIEKKFGKDIVIVIGDWCVTKQMRHIISTPNIGIKRKLKERFNVYNIDEFRTSCLYHKTEQKCSNLYLKDKKNELRKMHSILTFKMENTRRGCINRDYNGCLNIKKVFDCFMKKGERPQRYCRGFDLTEKDTNPSHEVSNGVMPYNKS